MTNTNRPGAKAATDVIRRHFGNRTNAVMDAYMRGTLAGMDMEAVVRITVRFQVWGSDVWAELVGLYED